MYTLLCNLFPSFSIKSSPLFIWGRDVWGSSLDIYLVFTVGLLQRKQQQGSKRVWYCSPRNAPQRISLDLAFLVCKTRGSEQPPATAAPFNVCVIRGHREKVLSLHTDSSKAFQDLSSFIPPSRFCLRHLVIPDPPFL